MAAPKCGIHKAYMSTCKVCGERFCWRCGHDCQAVVVTSGDHAMAMDAAYWSPRPSLARRWWDGLTGRNRSGGSR